MAAAAILSLAAFRDTQRRPAVRQRRQDRCDAWLNQLEARMEDRTPTVAELPQAVCALRQELTQAVTEGLLEQAHRVPLEQRTAACPPWGQMVSARGLPERTVETLGGALCLRRPSCYCLPGPQGTTPLEEVLPGTVCRTQPDVQKAAVQWTTEVPYETACARFEQLTGWPLSAHTAHDMTQAVAEGVTVWEVAPSRGESLGKITAVAMGQPWRPSLVLAIAGAAVPTRPETAQGRQPGRPQARATRARWTGEWREAKGFCCSRIAEDRIVQVLSWHQVQTDEAAVRLCVIADGARWLWTQALCPAAVEMWDDDHGRERLHTVAALP